MRNAVIGSFLLATAACTQPAGDSTPTTASSVEATPPAPSKARGLVLATVVTHDAKVQILTGERVIVRKTDGTLVADGVRVDELRNIDPVLEAVIRSAVASNGGGYLDATR